MKKFYAVWLLPLILLTSCWYDHNTNVSYHEDEEEFVMDAHYPRKQSRSVDAYLDRTIGRNSRSSFKDSRVDGTISWDDRGVFYIKKYPGRLKIKIDKESTSPGTYRDLKKICQGLKNVLTNN